jgi:hypothetical protein
VYAVHSVYVTCRLCMLVYAVHSLQEQKKLVDPFWKT